MKIKMAAIPRRIRSFWECFGVLTIELGSPGAQDGGELALESALQRLVELLARLGGQRRLHAAGAARGALVVGLRRAHLQRRTCNTKTNTIFNIFNLQHVEFFVVFSVVRVGGQMRGRK